MENKKTENPAPITIPLINPNEPEALLAGLFVHNGQWVETGFVLCILETTKSTAEIIAERKGFVVGLKCEQGATVQAGEILLWICEEFDSNLQPIVPINPSDKKSLLIDSIKTDLRITKPALKLAKAEGLNLDLLPRDHLVTESEVLNLIRKPNEEVTMQKLDFLPPDSESILIYGGGGHAKMLIDLLRDSNHYQIYGILDDGLALNSEIMGVRVLGGREILPKLHNSGVHLAVNGVGGIGNIKVRIKVFNLLQETGFTFPNTIHPSAIIEPSAFLAPGAQIFGRAYIGGEAQVGFGVIVSTGAILSHDCILDEYSIVSPGAILAGEVHVGSRALIGMGVTVNMRVKIGAGARIGNSATVNQDVPDGGVVRAGTVWPPY